MFGKGLAVIAALAVIVGIGIMSGGGHSQAATPTPGLYCHNNAVVPSTSASVGDWPVRILPSGAQTDVIACENGSLVKPAGFGQQYFVCRDGAVVALAAAAPGVPIGYAPGDRFIWTLTALAACHPPVTP